MSCTVCKNQSVYNNYCKEHFVEYFEDKVKNTIREYALLNKKDKIAVAVSGGKDSLSLLYLLHKLKYNVTALAVDEGISGYRDETLTHLISFCKKNKIKLRIITFKARFGKRLDEILKTGKYKPCTVCGIFRRYILNESSKEFEVLATGHNMDDEAQAILMNLIKGNTSILQRLGPISGTRKVKKFTKRVKPFYFCVEKEIMIYSFIMGLNCAFTECPNVDLAFRLKIRDILNELEWNSPGTKKNIVNWFIHYKKNLGLEKSSARYCNQCGQPSSQAICNACQLVIKINK